MKRNRRALSSIIGLSFMIIVMAGALATTAWVLQQQGRVSTEVTLKTNEYLNRLNEKIEISKVRINNDKLNLTLSNDGGSAAQVKTIYIVNETASPRQQFRYDIDYLVDGRSTVNNVGQTLAFTAKNTTSYSIRILTELGNAAAATYSPVSLTRIPLLLSVIPGTVTTGENVTLLYTITNNSTGDDPLTIYPTISKSISCPGGLTCTATKVSSGPTKVVIEKGHFALVKETYKIDGPPDMSVTFNASFTGAKSGNYVTAKATVIVVALSNDIVTSIATEPAMFLILPGPFGDTTDSRNERALWGAVVVNPTNSPMKVSRVLITIFSAAHQGDINIRKNCDFVAIFPSTSSEWGCPHNNMIQWKDLASPENLAPGETKSFLVRVEPGFLNVNREPGATVTSTVYTDIGIFTKTGYTTAMGKVVNPLGNVYLTDTTDTGTGSNGALNNANMLGHQLDIPPASTQTFYVAMADLDTRSGTDIETGARLIINVPPGFANVAVTSSSGFSTPTVTLRADGITQIVGATTQDLGGINAAEAFVIRFTAVTPSPTVDTTYIMFAFMEGLAEDEISAGALAQIALEIDVP